MFILNIVSLKFLLFLKNYTKLYKIIQLFKTGSKNLKFFMLLWREKKLKKNGTFQNPPKSEDFFQISSKILQNPPKSPPISSKILQNPPKSSETPPKILRVKMTFFLWRENSFFYFFYEGKKKMMIFFIFNLKLL